MARTAATLETELNNLALYSAEGPAITAWADAFGVYFADATTATAGAILAPGVATAKTAMAGAMTGLSTTGAVAIAAGITAFWATGAAAPVTWWAGCTLIVPPVAPLAALVAALGVTFALNIAEEASKAVSMARIAANIHTACTGGAATFPGPVVDPIL